MVVLSQMQNGRWWLSSKHMTVAVTTQDGIVVEGARIVTKFIGQPIVNLVRWMDSHGGLKVERL
jgi:hypothetical protein